MFLREQKIPFSNSSNPRASGVLQMEEVLDTSITVSKDQIRTFDQQTHLLRGLLQNKSLRLDKLRDYGLLRSALHPSRAAPSGLSQRSRSRVGRAHDRTHRLPLRRGRRPEKKKSQQKKAATQKGTKPYSPVNTPSRGSAPLPSPHRLDGWLIHRPLLDVRRRPTRRRTCKQESTTIKQGSKGNF